MSSMQFLSYSILGKKGEGTFSQVLKAQHIKNKKLVAIKCMKNVFKDIEQVNRLREIQALRRLSPHHNIIQLLEVLYDKSTGKLALVFELMDMNMYELIGSRETFLPEDRIKKYMFQLVKSMEHMHRNGIFHRDIKPENLLIMDDYLKLADFGSCRGIYSKQPYTEYISTRWYRAPECLLTDGYYNHKMDIWGVGCVFFEIIALYPLFPGQDEIDQIHKIHNILGTPSDKILNKFKKHASAHMDFNFPKKKGTGLRKLLPNASPDCLDLLEKMLAYNPDDRITSRQALRHPYFKELRDKERMSAKESLASKEGSGSREDHRKRSGASSGRSSDSFYPSPSPSPAPSAHSNNNNMESTTSSVVSQHNYPSHHDPLQSSFHNSNLPSIGKIKESSTHHNSNHNSNHTHHSNQIAGHNQNHNSSNHQGFNVSGPTSISGIGFSDNKNSLHKQPIKIKKKASMKDNNPYLGSVEPKQPTINSHTITLPSVYGKGTNNIHNQNSPKTLKLGKPKRKNGAPLNVYGAYRSNHPLP